MCFSFAVKFVAGTLVSLRKKKNTLNEKNVQLEKQNITQDPLNIDKKWMRKVKVK